jgi:hypothetical protein
MGATPLWFWQTDHGISVQAVEPPHVLDPDIVRAEQRRRSKKGNETNTNLAQFPAGELTEIRDAIAAYRRDENPNAKVNKIASHLAQKIGRGRRGYSSRSFRRKLAAMGYR